MKKYDAIVIGSGGGTKISSQASKLGYKVALIDEGPLGGTCLNRGCIPSKMLIHPANIAYMIKESGKFDIKADIKSINFAKIVKRVSKTVDDESASIVPGYNTNNKLDYYKAEAKFISDKIIKVKGKEITADKIFLATGARPFVPPIPGLEKTPYMTSTEALRNTKLPKKLVVIGGGFIAVELGNAYSSFGSEVHFLVRGKLISRSDSTVQEEFSKKFIKDHKIHLDCNTKKVEYKNKKFILSLEDKKGKSTMKADALLVATGVKPNSDNLGLENTKIKTNGRGFIKVDKYMETSVPGVYAIGDVVGNYMFRHSVNFEGEFLFDTLFVKKKKTPINYPPIPYAVFTNPEIGSVGKTEEQLKDEKVDYIVGINEYIASAMGMARLSDNGMVKLLFDRKTMKLLGAHIVGEEASNMIHQLIYAITFNATADDLLKMIYIHPALPEIVRNAVRRAKQQTRELI